MSAEARIDAEGERAGLRSSRAADARGRRSASGASGCRAEGSARELDEGGGLAPRRLIVLADDGARMEDAQKLATRLEARATLSPDEAASSPVHLRLDASGLSLVGDELSMRGDFAHLIPRIRPDRLGRELLVKAAKVKGLAGARDFASSRPLAVDATAGMGEDSLLLAAAGFEVLMFERNPVIAALLDDALHRAAEVPELAEVVGRMRLRHEDSIGALAGLGGDADVVLLDPMFPARTKSAAVKKKFQLLHLIEQPCADEEELFEAAVAAGPLKIVVKRPPKGPNLAGVKPAYSLGGKAVRYDVVVLPR